MRKYTWLAGLMLGLAWAGTVHAQSSSGSSLSSMLGFPSSVNVNVQPNFTNNSPMSYVNSNAPISTSMYRPSSYTLNNLFYTPTRTNTISNTVPWGQSAYPTPAQMQTAATSYFRPFQMYRATMIQPAGR